MILLDFYIPKRTNYERVVWMDIDCLSLLQKLVLQTNRICLDTKDGSTAPKGWKIYKCVQRFFQFQRNNAFLDFYIETAHKMIQRVDKDHIAPQMIGPKLLTALHNVVQLPTQQWLKRSPWLIQECADGGGPLLKQVRKALCKPLCGNLCSSF